MPIPVPVAWFSFTGSRASKLGDLGPNGKQAVQFWTQTKTVTARWSAHTKSVNTTISMRIPEALRASRAPLRTGGEGHLRSATRFLAPLRTGKAGSAWSRLGR